MDLAKVSHQDTESRKISLAVSKKEDVSMRPHQVIGFKHPKKKIPCPRLNKNEAA